MDRPVASSPHGPTAGAASKRATARRHAADETLENAAAYRPVLIAITTDAVQPDLERFTAEPLSPKPAAPPKVDDGTLARSAVEHGSQSRFVPLAAAALTVLVLIGVTISALLMRSGAASRIATSNAQPADLALPAIHTAAPAVDTSRSNATAPQNGEPISTGVPKDRPREIVAPTVRQSVVPRERPTPQTVRSSNSPRSPAALPPRERPVQPVSLPGSFASPLPNLEAISTASLGTLDTSVFHTTVFVEAKPIVTEPATAASETGAIQGVLGRYRTAFNELDAGAAGAIWPSLDTKALRRAFEQLEEQNLVFDACQIAVTDARAVASCGGTAWYVPRVGNKTQRGDWRQWEFNLRKIDDVWLIDTVSAR